MSANRLRWLLLVIIAAATVTAVVWFRTRAISGPYDTTMQPQAFVAVREGAPADITIKTLGEPTFRFEGD